MSVWQTPLATTFTRICPSPGSGIGICSMVRGFLNSCTTAPFIYFVIFFTSFLQLIEKESKRHFGFGALFQLNTELCLLTLPTSILTQFYVHHQTCFFPANAAANFH